MTDKREDLTDFTVKELRAELVKLGMSEEDAETFETKKPLIATIFSLRKSAVTPGEEKKDKKKYVSKREIMRAILVKQFEENPIRILIPCQGKEKPGVINWVYNKLSKRKEQVYVRGAFTPVQINGCKWLVPHGLYVEVPKMIADMISTSQNLTAEAGQEFLIDRIDPKTGKQVRDRLE